MTWKEFKASVENYPGLGDDTELFWIKWDSKNGLPHVVFVNDYEAFIEERPRQEGE
jgi:hypothetical protein